jgi:hypothetical protein
MVGSARVSFLPTPLKPASAFPLAVGALAGVVAACAGGLTLLAGLVELPSPGTVPFGEVPGGADPGEVGCGLGPAPVG